MRLARGKQHEATVMLPEAVVQASPNAPYYSTLRTLLSQAQFVASQGAAAYLNEDDEVERDMVSLMGDIQNILIRIS